MDVNLHSIMEVSRCNGPGRRMVVWFQGCTLNCPGCFNPDTHPHEPRIVMAVDDLAARIKGEARTIEGISISGGEPLEQREALIELLSRVRAETDLSTLLFTGWTWEEIGALPERDALISALDAVVAGRYDRTQRLDGTGEGACATDGLRSSANQTLHLLTGRYAPSDLENIPPAEIVIDSSGTITISGVDPVRVVDGA